MLDVVFGHDAIKKELILLKANLPHVLLFCGPHGVGKTFTAYSYIDELYGLKDRLYCHPDICLFESDTKVFKIDMVHKIQEKANTTPFELDKKFFILKNINRMNKESSNACLKMLEDCPAQNYFILTSENKENILKTVISRSVSFDFFPIPNLKEFFENLTDLEIGILQGCIGNKRLLEDIDSKELYENIKTFLSNFNKQDYSDTLFWFKGISKEINISVIYLVMRYVVTEELKNGKNSSELCQFAKNLNNFKEKFYMNLNLENHFKNLLIQVKRYS